MPERPGALGSLAAVLISNLLPGLAWFATIWMWVAMLKSGPYPGAGVPWPSDLSFIFLALATSLALGYVADGLRHFSVLGISFAGIQEAIADKFRPFPPVIREKSTTGIRRPSPGQYIECLAITKRGTLRQQVEMQRWLRIEIYHPGELLSNLYLVSPFLGWALASYLSLPIPPPVLSVLLVAFLVPILIEGSVDIRNYNRYCGLLFLDKTTNEGPSDG